ncbi:hypothetical protein NC651_002905 [Populus alba x Populus x berolinensis]|nr:hypothetical protein NC651_002905 [Populus alba x Populus x berolinensis]
MNDPRYGYKLLSSIKALASSTVRWQLPCLQTNFTGVYQGPPPVMAPPQDYAPPLPQRQVGFLEGCLAVSWMSAAVTLQLYSSPNDACDYTAQRVFMCVILGHM